MPVDGDKAMKKVVKKVFPSACHRLCTWHLLRNIKSHVRCKEFKVSFINFMKLKYPTDEFDEDCGSLVRSCRLENNAYVAKLYCTRGVWAYSYLGGISLVECVQHRGEKK